MLSSTITPSRPEGLNQVTHLIWPEDALPFYRFSQQIMNFLPSSAVLITGGVRLAAGETNGTDIRAYNSAFVVDRDGKVLSYYDKIHLVPFGEYLPLQTLFEKFGLVQLFKMSAGLSRGQAATALPHRALPISCR